MNKRYFLVVYSGSNPSGTSTFRGRLHVVQHDGRFLNNKTIQNEILKLHPIAETPLSVMVESFFEVSEEDFIEFTK